MASDPTLAASPPAGRCPRGMRSLQRSVVAWLSARAWWQLALLVALVAIAVYANSLANGFALDDVPIIQRNTSLHDGTALADYFVSQYWPTLNRAGAVYRPITIVSAALDWHWTAGAAWGFHLTNTILHGVATVLVLALLARLGVRRALACAGALLFALHPVHVEAVSNVIGRAEVLATIFVLLGTLLYLSSAPRLVVALGCAASYALALGAKESGVSMPALMALLGTVQGYRDDRSAASAPRRLLGSAAHVLWGDLPVWLLMGAALAGYCWLRWIVLGNVHGSMLAPGLDTTSASARVATAISVWPHYARLLFWPFHLAADYSPNAIRMTSWQDWRVWGSLAAGATAGGLSFRAMWHGRMGPLLLLGWGALSLLVVSNLLFPVGILLAERNLYLASVLVAFLPAWWVERRPCGAAASGAAARIVRGRNATLGLAVLMLVGAAWGVRTWTRTPVWRSTPTYIRSVIRDVPESYRAMYYEGELLGEAGHPEAAMRLFARASAVAPADALVHLLYATAAKDAGHTDRALREALDGFSFEMGYSFLVVLDILIDSHREEEALPILELGLRRYAANPDLNRRAREIYAALDMPEELHATEVRLTNAATAPLHRVLADLTAHDTAAVRRTVKIVHTSTWPDEVRDALERLRATLPDSVRGP